jgi:hypothetical protein
MWWRASQPGNFERRSGQRPAGARETWETKNHCLRGGWGLDHHCICRQIHCMARGQSCQLGRIDWTRRHARASVHASIHVAVARRLFLAYIGRSMQGGICGKIGYKKPLKNDTKNMCATFVLLLTWQVTRWSHFRCLRRVTCHALRYQPTIPEDE